MKRKLTHTFLSYSSFLFAHPECRWVGRPLVAVATTSVSSWWSVHLPRGGVSLHCAMSFSTRRGRVCVFECVCVRMLGVCVCVCLQQWDKKQQRHQVHTHTHTHTALNLEINENHLSEMSRFYELKHCDGRNDFHHLGVFFFFLFFLECWQRTHDFTMT